MCSAGRPAQQQRETTQRRRIRTRHECKNNTATKQTHTAVTQQHTNKQHNKGQQQQQHNSMPNKNATNEHDTQRANTRCIKPSCSSINSFSSSTVMLSSAITLTVLPVNIFINNWCPPCCVACGCFVGIRSQFASLCSSIALTACTRQKFKTRKSKRTIVKRRR